MFRAVSIRIYYAVLIATPEASLSLVQMIYCAGRIEDIKNNLVHYAYSEVGSLMKLFLPLQVANVSMRLHYTYYIHANRTWMSIHANYKCT